MSATTWFIIAIVGFSLAGIALVASIIIFIKMNIPAIIGDLTGKTVAREIKEIREFNKTHGDRRFRPSEVNLERGTLTDKINNSKGSNSTSENTHSARWVNVGNSSNKANMYNANSKHVKESVDNGGDATSLLSDDATEILDSNATEILDSNATEILDSNATEVLSADTNEVPDNTVNREYASSATTVLSDSTTVLSDKAEASEYKQSPVNFKVIRNEILIHTEETI